MVLESPDLPDKKEEFRDKSEPSNLHQSILLEKRATNQTPGLPETKLDDLGFAADKEFAGLLACTGDQSPQTPSDKSKLQEKLGSFGKTAEQLSPLIDFMPSVRDLQAEKKDDSGLLVQLTSAEASKMLSSGKGQAQIRLKSVEFDKDVRLTLNADGKVTDISGIKVNGSIPPDFRIGGLNAREPFSARITEARLTTEEGKTYLVTDIAPSPDIPNDKYQIKIPLKNDRVQEVAKSYPDDKYPSLSLRQFTDIAEATVKNPDQLKEFKSNLEKFVAIARANDIPQIALDKTYGQWARLLQYKGDGPLSKEKMTDIARDRLSQLADPHAPYLQTEDFLDDIRKEVDSAFRGKVRPEF